MLTRLRALCVQAWEAQFPAEAPSPRGGEEGPLDTGAEGREYEAILHDLLADDYAQHAEAYEAAPRQMYGLPFQELRARAEGRGLSALPGETQEDWDRRVHQLRARRGDPLGAYLEGMLAARRSDVEVRRPRAHVARLRRHDARVRCWRAAVATRRGCGAGVWRLRPAVRRRGTPIWRRLIWARTRSLTTARGTATSATMRVPPFPRVFVSSWQCCCGSCTGLRASVGGWRCWSASGPSLPRTPTPGSLRC